MTPLEARNVDELRAAMAAAGRVKFVLFWGNEPTQDGSLSSSCLSQWYDAPFEVAGIRYATAEHYMMAAKARLFGDGAAEQRALSAKTPGEAKAIGREVEGFERSVWEAQRIGVVVDGNVAKFSQDRALGEYLLGTRNRVLVEASPTDLIWGVGFEATDPRATRPEAWRGLNLLGFALMEARARLAAEGRLGQEPGRGA